MKPVIASAAAILAIVAVALVLLMTRADRYVAAALEEHLAAATGTRAAVDSVAISYSDARVTVSGVTVANPPGFRNGPALSLQDIDVAIDIGSLDDEALRIPAIVVRGATVNAEQRGREANVIGILEHLRREESGDQPDEAEEGLIVIDSFELTDARIIVTADSLAEPAELALGPVRVEGIGSSNEPANYEQATQAVLGAIFRAARVALRERLGETAGAAAKEELENAIRERLDELGQ